MTESDGTLWLRESIERLKAEETDGLCAEKLFRNSEEYVHFIDILSWLRDALRGQRFEGAAEYIDGMHDLIRRDIRCKMMILNIIDEELLGDADGGYKARNPESFFNPVVKK